MQLILPSVRNYGSRRAAEIPENPATELTRGRYERQLAGDFSPNPK